MATNFETEHYEFTTQLTIGEAGEETLDQFFASWYYVEPVSIEQQKHGIDRIFTTHNTNRVLTIEYKTDYKTTYTGNVFFETVSIDTTATPGWLFTSEAAILVYFIPQEYVAYCSWFQLLREHFLPRLDTYPERSIPNDGYNTVGRLIPIDDFAECCCNILTIGECNHD